MASDKLKVLIVDDEKIVRDFFKRLLSLLGLEAKDAEDGYKAVEMAKNEDFDLIFMDVRMPGLDGLETYRKIHKISPGTRVVMITGYAVEEILEQGKSEGVFSAIRKPFNINQIREVIDKIIAGKTKGTISALFIDDDETVLGFFSNLLKERNITYKLACDKSSALEEARKEKFDLVFLDLVLKDAGVLEVYNEIRKILPEAAVILITGYPQMVPEVKDKMEISGCLYKPFDIESVIDCVEKARLGLQKKSK